MGACKSLFWNWKTGKIKMFYILPYMFFCDPSNMSYSTTFQRLFHILCPSLVRQVSLNPSLLPHFNYWIVKNHTTNGISRGLNRDPCPKAGYYSRQTFANLFSRSASPQWSAVLIPLPFLLTSVLTPAHHTWVHTLHLASVHMSSPEQLGRSTSQPCTSFPCVSVGPAYLLRALMVTRDNLSSSIPMQGAQSPGCSFAGCPWLPTGQPGVWA